MIARLSLLGALLVAVPLVPAEGQVMYGRAGFVIAPWIYYPPRIPYAPFATIEESVLYFESAEACLRVGRCTTLDVYLFQGQVNRLQRLAPIPPPQEASWFPHARPRPVPPTPEQDIVPEYRSASQVRSEYVDVGRPKPAAQVSGQGG